MSKEIGKLATTELAEAGGRVPRLISSAGDDAITCFVEFFLTVTDFGGGSIGSRRGSRR